VIAELSLAPTIGACSALVGFTHYKAHQMKVIINQNICIWRGVGEGGIFSLLLKSERDLTLAVGVRSRLLPLFQRDIHDYNVASTYAWWRASKVLYHFCAALL
jgi:hypothetical protein